MRLPIRTYGLRIRMMRTGDSLLDRALGIDTAGWVGNEKLGFGTDVGNPYQPSNWVNVISVMRLLRSLEVAPADGFLELGCGKGQILFAAAHFPFGRAIGLDISAPLVAIARQNLDPARHRLACPQVELVVANGADYPIPDDINTCYLYNSFPGPVLEEVMERMEESLRQRPRTMRLMYLNTEHQDIVLRHGFVEERRIRRLKLFVRRAASDGLAAA